MYKITYMKFIFFLSINLKSGINPLNILLLNISIKLFDFKTHAVLKLPSSVTISL